MHDAYLAGLIDGEGSIMLVGQGLRRSRRPQIAVAITERHVLEAIQDAHGGFIRQRTNVLQWNLNGFPALRVLQRVEPHLVIERRRALAKLLLSDPIIPRTDITRAGKIAHNEAVYQQMKERNAQRSERLLPKARRLPKDADFAYLAGILDGEGWIGERRIEVCSTDPELIAYLQSRFEGKTYPDYRAERGNRRPTWTWRRSPKGCTWAARVADLMLLDRKAASLRAWGP